MRTNSPPTWPMRDLLFDDAGAPIATTDQWQRQAGQIHEKFVRTIGSTPETQRLHGYEMDESMVEDGIRRRLVRIAVDVDDIMEAWLLEPIEVKDDTKVAIAPHPTTPPGKDAVAGVDPSAKHPYGLELAKLGWIVLAPDGHAVERRFAKGLRAYDTARFYERWPGWSSVGKIIADHRICVDLLERLPQTRGRPVSIIGHSLGGQTAIYTAAVEPRIVAAVCNCGVYPFADSIARDHWFRDKWYIYFKDPVLKQSVKEGPQPYWDFHELCSLIAPRKLMIFWAPNDYCGAHTGGIHRAAEQLHRVWNLLDAGGHLTTVIHNEGHVFQPWHRAYAYAWLAGSPTGPETATTEDVRKPNRALR